MKRVIHFSGALFVEFRTDKRYVVCHRVGYCKAIWPQDKSIDNITCIKCLHYMCGCALRAKDHDTYAKLYQKIITQDNRFKKIKPIEHSDITYL
jgi:hypothetical protein